MIERDVPFRKRPLRAGADSRAVRLAIVASLFIVAFLPAIVLAADSTAAGVKSPWASIQSGLDTVLALVWPIATAIAAVGAAAMMGYQLYKDLTGVRGRFNAEHVRKWLDAQLAQATIPALSAERAEQSLVELATAGSAAALYSLEIPRLAAQMAAAGQIAVEWPKDHRELVVALGARVPREDLEVVLAPPARGAVAGDEAAIRAERERSARYLDAKTRVGSYMQRSIDGFQIALDDRWTYENRLVTSILCVVMTLITFVVNAALGAAGMADVAGYVVVGVLSAFFAPVSKDLVTALEQLKGRPR